MALEREGIGIKRDARIVVAGGGLAGLGAALVLAKAGLQVKLYERSGVLGGRAGSFFDTKLGAQLDHGQHILLGCCTNLLDFYARIGASRYIHFCDSIAFAHNGRISRMIRRSLPEPMHLLPSFLALNQLGLADKLRVSRLLWSAARKIHPDISAKDWLLSTGQSEQAITRFWEPVITGALNDAPDRVSARYAAMVVRQAMLANRAGFPMGIPKIPLSQLHNELPMRTLESLGAKIHLKDRVTEVFPGSGGAVSAVTESGETVKADYIILATDLQSLPAGVKETLGPSACEECKCIPIVTHYLWFAEHLDIPPALAMPEGAFQWCINRSIAAQHASQTVSCLALVASAARSQVRMADNDLYRLGFAELCQSLGRKLPDPAAFRVVRHKFATFSPSVRFDRVRPRQRTSIPRVFIAGDWTATGWPGTMEGAVRSGYMCAADILSQECIECTVPVPDLRPEGFSKLLLKSAETH